MTVPTCTHGGASCTSWVLVRRSTGQAIGETWKAYAELAARIRPDRVELVRPCVWLARVNQAIWRQYAR